MADVFPVIPEALPAQVAESIGRSPAFVFHEDGRSGSFQLTRVRRGVEVRFTVRLHTGESEEVTTFVSE